MTKEQYKRLLQLRKSEEMMFYELVKLSGLSPRELIQRLPINHKRAAYILEKWCRNGWYEYGTSLDNGWLVEKRFWYK
ncbi:hypothetical protein CON36_36425 [Bacillus cereus]|uniref:Uncharacterized protein n=1 Tax=Bacillus cereus TaxID=1396 RepID=A0A9X6XUL5_BACCE|nr:hypothetical protein [Bacillus cereus]PDZ93950.1 hypothetical protein CON36_36425 [Bacillus cereus]